MARSEIRSWARATPARTRGANVIVEAVGVEGEPCADPRRGEALEHRLLARVRRLAPFQQPVHEADEALVTGRVVVPHRPVERGRGRGRGTQARRQRFDAVGLHDRPQVLDVVRTEDLGAADDEDEIGLDRQHVGESVGQIPLEAGPDDQVRPRGRAGGPGAHVVRVGAEEVFELHHVVAVGHLGNVQDHGLGTEVERGHRVGRVRVGGDDVLETGIEGHGVTVYLVDRPPVGGEGRHQERSEAVPVAHQHREGEDVGLLGDRRELVGRQGLLTHRCLHGGLDGRP